MILIDGFSVEFSFNINKLSINRSDKTIIVDHQFRNIEFGILLFMIYSTLYQKECNGDLFESDLKALERLKNEGFEIDNKFLIKAINTIKNTERIQNLIKG